MKILMPGVRVAVLQFGDVVRRGADVEAVIDEATSRRRGPAFRRSRCLRRRRRDRVRHFQERRHAPFGAGPRRRVQVFLVRQARLAEMDLVVDHARQEG